MTDFMRDVYTVIDAVLSSAPFPLREMTEHVKKAKGKGLRAQLVEAGTYLGDNGSQEAVTQAAAIELLHLSSLVHDDVIDASPLRRGQESVYKRFGAKHAVLLGDYLFTRCFSLLSDDKDTLRAASYCVGKLCEGEILQMANAQKVHITFREYLRAIAGKTAALFGLAAGCGARCGGAKKNAIKRAVQAGYHMGVLFQLIDDCLDYTGENSQKPPLIDLDEGVITLPLLYALRKQPDLDLSNQKSVLLAVQNARGVEKTKAMAQRYYEKAWRDISRFPHQLGRGQFLNLLERMYHRSF